MTLRRLVTIAALLLLAATDAANAQVTPARRPAPPPRPRRPRTHFVRISVNAGLAIPGQTVDEDLTPTVNAESARTEASFSLATAPLIDVGADVRIKPRIAVGAALTFEQRQSDGEVTASIPHPFYFNQPRSVSGHFSDLDGRTIGIHPFVRWFKPLTRRLELSIAGGPSIFIVRQEFVTGVVDSSAYPYDTAAFGGVQTTTLEESGFGAHASADVAYTMTKKVSLGALVRYAAGNATFTPAGGTIALRAGGLQAGGGLRITF